jgi:predicted 3-demethylubiquinone-9 3-methyltransferase (glyoxalase superfamily)
VQFYTSIFKNSKTTGVTHYPEEGPGPAETVMTITFQLDGQEFIALNGGPVYQFSPAISLFVNCETQEEIDELWENSLEAERPWNAAGSRTSALR